MSNQPTRRELLGHAARGAGLLGVGGLAAHLVARAGSEGAWWIDPEKCINIRLDAVGVEVCERCATSCVRLMSAIRAVNDYARCGTAVICPAYFDVDSELGADGLPTKKLCPRDAIVRKPIGELDPEDPWNNFFEYVIDEEQCDGCGRCVMACKEPNCWGSIRLLVRYDLCHHCNRCAVAVACPQDAIVRAPIDRIVG